MTDQVLLVSHLILTSKKVKKDRHWSGSFDEKKRSAVTSYVTSSLCETFFFSVFSRSSREVTEVTLPPLDLTWNSLPKRAWVSDKLIHLKKASVSLCNFPFPCVILLCTCQDVVQELCYSSLGCHFHSLRHDLFLRSHSTDSQVNCIQSDLITLSSSLLSSWWCCWYLVSGLTFETEEDDDEKLMEKSIWNFGSFSVVLVFEILNSIGQKGLNL